MTRTQDLSDNLGNDLAQNSAKEFHKHVLTAITSGVTDDQISIAIRNNAETLKVLYKKETGEDLDVEEYIKTELGNEHFLALLSDPFDLNDED